MEYLFVQKPTAQHGTSALLQVPCQRVHLREHRVFLWPKKANGTEALSEEVERLQPEINEYRQQFGEHVP